MISVRLVVLVLLLALPGVAEARWLEARSPNFIVYSDGPEAELRQSAATLEAYDQLLRLLTGTTAPPSPAPLKVFLVGRQDAFRQVIADIKPQVSGFYTSRVGGTEAFALRAARGNDNGQQVLLHEYAHHFMFRYYPAYYPAWYIEGFAEFMMTVRILPDRIELGRSNPARASFLLRGTWEPIERVLTEGAQGLGPQQTAQFYAQAWLMTHFILTSDERRAGLSRYLAALHRGVAEAEAFQTAFGMDHRAFESELRRYMSKINYGVIPRPAAPDAKITVTALPEAADGLLLLHEALVLGFGSREAEADNLADVRRTAGRTPDDPYARRVLARAEIASGDRDKGRTMVDELLKAMPNDGELLYLRGLAEFYEGRSKPEERAARFAAARPWFDKAVDADPSLYPARYRLAQTTPGAGEADELLVAHRLAPTVAEIAYNAAAQLAAQRRYAEAEAALLPLATNPHAGLSEQARTLLGEVRSAQRGAVQAEAPTGARRAP